MSDTPNTGRPSFWRRKLADLFGIDPRSLALFRMAAGLLLLYDQTLRLSELDVFFTTGSIVPDELVRGHPLYDWTLHLLDGSSGFQTALFALAMVFALSLLLGYRTRTSTLFSWLLLASVHNRTPLVGNGGDLMLRLLLFWGMFVPLGRCWSIDALLRGTRENGPSGADEQQSASGKTDSRYRPVVSLGTTAMLLQLCFMYFFSGIYKFNQDWLGSDWLGGNALYWTMRFDYFTLPPAHQLAEWPALLQVLTLATLWLELLGPLLAFFPWQTGKIRLALIAAFAALHVTIQLTLTVGMFSTVSIAGWMLFLPSGFWNSRGMNGLGRAFAARLPSTAGLAITPPRPLVPRRLGATAAVAAQAVCGLLLLYAFLFNVSPLAAEAVKSAPQRAAWLRWAVFPDPLVKFGITLTLDQRWDMFRHSPQKVDGWYVARGWRADGRVIDLLQHGRPATDDKPALASACFPNAHWRYFFSYLTDDEYRKYRHGAAEYLLRRWNARHDPQHQVRRLELDWYDEWSSSQSPGAGFVQKVLAEVELEPASPSDGLELPPGLELQPWEK